MRTFKIGYFQFNPVFKNIKANLQKIKEAVSKIETDLIVLPELATVGYNFRSSEELLPYAEERGGEHTQFFLELAAEKNMVIVSGIAEKEGDKLYNSQFAFFPDGRMIVYRKLHLFFREKLIFQPGDKGIIDFEYRGVKFGMMICFDWIFPEMARVLALRGVQVILHSANLVLPGLGQMGMRMRSIENRVFTITANRIGEERGLKFTGRSQIIAPDGKVLANSSEDEEAIEIVEIDPERAKDKHITELNDLFEDRRVEFYKELC